VLLKDFLSRASPEQSETLIWEGEKKMKSPKRVLALIVMAALVTFAAGAAQATNFGPGVTYTEVASPGYTGFVLDNIPTADPPIKLASDLEVPFDPFGAGYDTSDGIQFYAADLWTPYTDLTPLAFSPGFWKLLPDGISWVLPAVTPAGSENEPAFEPAAAWYFTNKGQWVDGTPAFVKFLEPDGSFSDLITLNNNGPDGAAVIIFQSDPVPIPPAMWLFGSGLLGLAGLRRFRKS
jgi:hypothetical protein